MIESEVIEFFDWMLKKTEEEIDFFKSFVDENELNSIEKRKYYIETAISAIKETHQYQAIGTVDDFKKYSELLRDVKDLKGFLSVIDEWNYFKKISQIQIVGEACKQATPKEPYTYITSKGEIRYECPCCYENGRKKVLQKYQKFCSECGKAIEWIKTSKEKLNNKK